MPLSFYLFDYVLSVSLLGVNSYGQDRMWFTWLQKDMWIRLARDTELNSYMENTKEVMIQYYYQNSDDVYVYIC